MKISPFIYKSKILIRIWVIFAGAWLFITFLQLIAGYSCTGYASLFKGTTSTIEAFLAVFCLIFFSGWWIAEGVQCYKLLKEYKDFIKSLNKTPEMKEILFRIKISLTLIVFGLGFSIIAGTMNHFNWIFILSIFGLKFYYVYLCKKLINILGVDDLPLPKKNAFHNFSEDF